MPESPSCQEFESAWTALDAAEPLPAPLARHLAACERCRVRAASDPSRLFAVLRGVAPEPAPAWQPFWASVSAGGAERERARRARRAWVAASAAALLVAGALWLMRPGLLGPARRLETAALPAPAPAGAGAVLPASAPPTLEAITSPAARVVELKIFGEQDQVTEIILIIDEGIEL